MPSKTLKARWSKKEKDILVTYPDKCDGSLLYSIFCSKRHSPLSGWYSSFLEELDKRGYDITTLKFSISTKEKK